MMSLQPTAPIFASGPDPMSWEELVQIAEPVLQRVLSAKLARSGFNDADTRADLRSEVIVRLADRLQRDEERSAMPIESVRDYVAVVACHVFDDFLRVKYPVRTRLKNRIRYLLGHDARFGIWSAGRTLVAGLATWTGRNAITPPRLSEVRTASRELGEVLVLLFRTADGPLELDDVVDAVADLTGERDAPAVTLRFADVSEAASPDAVETFERGEFLRRLWSEICALPPRQRAALLLNLRGEGDEAALHFFTLLGIVPPDAIADVLSIDRHRFDQLWRELPIDDERIAAMLGVTRQQVVNLRKSARARLGRRLPR